MKNEKSNQETSRREEKSSRLNIIISNQNRKRIEFISQEMELETITDVIKNALRLLEYIIKVNKNGGKIFVQMPNEEKTQIEIFGISE